MEKISLSKTKLEFWGNLWCQLTLKLHLTSFFCFAWHTLTDNFLPLFRCTFWEMVSIPQWKIYTVKVIPDINFKNKGIFNENSVVDFFFEDRQLPRLTRGQMHRCVGFLDKKSGTFNCVSIRPSKQTELLCMADFLKGSELVMQQQLATFKEDWKLE